MSLFGSLALTTQVVSAQTSEIVLEPSESKITIPVQLPYEGYGVNVLLKKDGELILNQNNINYEWGGSSKYLKVESNGFNNGCPYNVISPCPNMHADLRGLLPGTVTIPVKAYQNGKIIASTVITVEITDSGYSLSPSESNISISLESNYPQYGVNVLLKRNNNLILDQQGIYYIWKNSNNNVVSVFDSGFSSGCPYNLVAPCPNMHALLQAKNVGKAKIEVEAWLENTLLEVAHIDVNVVGSEATTPQPTPTIPTKSPNIEEKTIPNQEKYENSQKNNYEGERVLRLEHQVEELQAKVNNQETIIERITSWFKKVFKFDI